MNNRYININEIENLDRNGNEKISLGIKLTAIIVLILFLTGIILGIIGLITVMSEATVKILGW